MRSFVLTTLVIFTFSLVSFSQAKSNVAILNQIKTLKAEKYLELNYDKSANFTKILAFGEDFGGSQNKNNGLSAFSFGMTFNYQGDKLLTSPDSFILTFWAKSSKHKFAESHSLKIVLNGETLDLGDARYATKASEKEMEYLNFIISRENLRKLADSSSAQMMIGNAKFNFTSAHLKLFKNLLEISDPASN